VPALRVTIDDLQLMYALTAFMETRKTDTEFQGFLEDLVHELPAVPDAIGAMPMIFPLTQQAVNTVHCIAAYATYIGEHEDACEELAQRAAALVRVLPPIRQTVTLGADRDIA
jgi:hypothetical protein